ncbi:hypothetical protein [Serratia marcescens]|uniref:hypothetical protein n=1 Tax=Serratia marcescens TaxID=615 RepID=UPI00137800AF|nr:hypothetical protein [Serratia marcescens]NCI84518.1 hypothetical protein [Serratia marcescens]NDI95903.1 hypothetical protein [Serratia marcescens]NDJ65020.1 hypothetical protein [Serratia marcescens]HAT3781512.1 hypothetical protein [Serratia marcescens]HAT3850627.1 hypothetical protein [Serratia marcescens]
MRVVWFFFLILLSGCSGKWVSSGYVSENFNSADAACSDAAKAEFPVRNEVAQRTKFGQRVESCKKKEDCDGKSYKVTEVPTIESYAMDVNHESRDDYYLSCMKSKGWKKEYHIF